MESQTNEEKHTECKIDEEKYDYESYDKEALIQILIGKDELLVQKAEDETLLQIRIEKLTEYNAFLRERLKTLSSELQKHIENASKEPESKYTQTPILDDGEIEGSLLEMPENEERHGNRNDYGDKPMPDWIQSTENESAFSISDAIRATAEAELKNIETDVVESALVNGDQSNSDYVFDASSGYYYHPTTGYYWDPTSGLFYDYTSGTYYKYNETKGEYEVHSQVDPAENSISSEKFKFDGKLRPEKSSKNKTHSSTSSKRKKASRRKVKLKISKKKDRHCLNVDSKKIYAHRKDDVDKIKRKARNYRYLSDCDEESSGSLATDESELESDPESGEIFSSSSSDVEIIEVQEEMSCDTATGNSDIYSGEQQYSEEMAENYPPCIRAIVQESEKLCAGTLFIITCAGGTIGRDSAAKHIMEIPDLGVSKNHASIEYDYDLSCYKVTDLGSQNGTRVNGNRVCQRELTSGSHPLDHGDVLSVGKSVTVLLHIHQGHETCEDCEPGQIQAKLKALNPVKNSHIVMTREERKQQQKRELKKIKKKYGLQNSYFENEGAVPVDPDYTDKAHLRRKFIGSEDGSGSTRMENPASVHCPIAPSNKGHKLLAKMGWKEGQGLGRANAGIAEPINVELRINQSAGLGAREGHSLPLDRVQDTNKAKRWSQAQQRFNRLQPTNDPLEDDGESTPHSETKANSNTNSISKSVCLDMSQQQQESSSLVKSSDKTSRSKPRMSWHKGETETLSDDLL